MNETTQTVLALISHTLFNKPLPDFPPSLDWNDVFNECKSQSIAVLFTDILDNLPVSDELRIKWGYSCIRGVQKSRAILKIQNELHSLFLKGQIDYAVLKGFSAAQYYPKPQYRTMGDLDIIVAHSDYEIAQTIMNNNGFELDFNPESYNLRHMTYMKNGIEIELHRYFATDGNKRVDDNSLDGRIVKVLSSAVEKHYSITDNSAEQYFNSLPDFENGLVLLKHIAMHVSSGLGYRQILDFLLYCESCLNDTVWYEGFCQVAKEMKLEKLAKVCVRMGQQYFGMGKEITWCSDISESESTELLEYLSKSGNFGRKNESGDERITRVIRNTHGSPLALIRYEQKSGLKYWKAVKKHSILKPFAWIYGSVRDFKRLINEKSMGEALKKLSCRKDSVSIEKTLGL